MVPVCHVRMGSTGVRASVWTASGMGHWKRLIKIAGGTDCYYCINNMTCLIHVFYYLVVHVPVPDHFAVIMLPVYVVTLPVSCYTFCGGILLMYMYICYFAWYMLLFLWWHTTHVLHCIYSVFWIPCRHHYCICTTQYCGYIAYAHLHVHIAYAHLYGHCYHVTTRRQYLWYQPDTPKDMTRW